MFLSVIGRNLLLLLNNFKKGKTDPLEPETFPYLAIENLVPPKPESY